MRPMLEEVYARTRLDNGLSVPQTRNLSRSWFSGIHAQLNYSQHRTSGNVYDENL